MFQILQNFSVQIADTIAVKELNLIIFYTNSCDELIVKIRCLMYYLNACMLKNYRKCY